MSTASGSTSSEGDTAEAAGKTASTSSKPRRARQNSRIFDAPTAPILPEPVRLSDSGLAKEALHAERDATVGLGRPFDLLENALLLHVLHGGLTPRSAAKGEQREPAVRRSGRFGGVSHISLEPR